MSKLGFVPGDHRRSFEHCCEFTSTVSPPLRISILKSSEFWSQVEAALDHLRGENEAAAIAKQTARSDSDPVGVRYVEELFRKPHLGSIDAPIAALAELMEIYTIRTFLRHSESRRF